MIARLSAVQLSAVVAVMTILVLTLVVVVGSHFERHPGPLAPVPMAVQPVLVTITVDAISGGWL